VNARTQPVVPLQAISPLTRESVVSDETQGVEGKQAIALPDDLMDDETSASSDDSLA
jgi:hypothetical protein